MRVRLRRLAAVAFGVCAVLGRAEDAGSELPREAARVSRRRDSGARADLIVSALEKRIRGEAALGDVRVDVDWPRESRLLSVRIYGNGVAIWNRSLQFSLSKSGLVAALKAIREARFASMPSHFGDAEEEERNEGPRLKGRVAVRMGKLSWTVLQLIDGEQSPALAALAERILDTCEGPAQVGVGAANLNDGLEKIATGVLAPETLEVTVQRWSSGSAAGSTRSGWVLRAEGRQLTDQQLPAGQTDRELILSEPSFRTLSRLLSDSRPLEIPTNVFADEYVDLRLQVLNWSRIISARRFSGMAAETHGARQKSFDRLLASLTALRERVRESGVAVRAAVPMPKDKSALEK